MAPGNLDVKHDAFSASPSFVICPKAFLLRRLLRSDAGVTANTEKGANPASHSAGGQCGYFCPLKGLLNDHFFQGGSLPQKWEKNHRGCPNSVGDPVHLCFPRNERVTATFHTASYVSELGTTLSRKSWNRFKGSCIKAKETHEPGDLNLATCFGSHTGKEPWPAQAEPLKPPFQATCGHTELWPQNLR